jgi:hypothetical protein
MEKSNSSNPNQTRTFNVDVKVVSDGEIKRIQIHDPKVVSDGKTKIISVDEEVWKDIPGHEGLYQASDGGKIKSCKRNKPMSLVEKKKRLHNGRVLLPYLTVTLRKDGLRKKYFVHRLIALTFLGKIPDGFVVKHLDDNPQNNNVNNLKIDTQSQNQVDCYDRGRRRISKVTDGMKQYVKNKQKGIIAFNKQTNAALFFDSIRECQRFLNLNIASMWKVLNNKLKSTKGYELKYTERIG